MTLMGWRVSTIAVRFKTAGRQRNIDAHACREHLAASTTAAVRVSPNPTTRSATHRDSGSYRSLAGAAASLGAHHPMSSAYRRCLPDMPAVVDDKEGAPVVIVAGHLMVEPEQRASYLADCVAVVEQARRADGCLDYAISADIIDPGRINIHERWTSQSAVEAFRGGGPSADQSAAMVSASVSEYDVAAERRLSGGED